MTDIIAVIAGLKGMAAMSGASTETIAAAEERLGLRFAEDYRDYIAKYGTISARHIEITGLTESKRLNVMDVTLECRQRSQLPPDMYVIDDTGIEGVLVLQNKTGEIFEFQNGMATKIFPCLADYLLSL